MKPTLGQALFLSLCGLAVGMAVLFQVVSASSRQAITESSERVRELAVREISDRVNHFLQDAPKLVSLYQRELTRGLTDGRNPAEVEKALFALLLSNPNVAELTLTYGEQTGFDEAGNIQLAPASRGQVSVDRLALTGGGERLRSRQLRVSGNAFTGILRDLSRPEPIDRIPETPLNGEFPDPTQHPTFVTPAREDFHGELLWSDLHHSQLDADLPTADQRAEVSVQQVITDSAGKFVGVLRVGLFAEQLAAAIQLPIATAGEMDPHRIFLCDPDGRLVARLSPQDRLEEIDDDLRVSPSNPPPEVKAALASPLLERAVRENDFVSDQFEHGGEEFLSTFRELPGTQSWVVGIVVPRSYYLGKLAAIRQRLLAILLGIMLALVVVGGVILHQVKRAQGQITRESTKMKEFAFAPAPMSSAFRDVSDVLESMEQAKTAMRAMGKYVPVDLVRRLYQQSSEPALGAEQVEVSIMFTDIRGFTSISERLEPEDLADALGRYLDVMTQIIQKETQGTIDKYIGDAIMTFWNQPEPVAQHSRMACLAALRCREAGRALARSPEWAGRPPFETRFGLHRGSALIGHFGSRDRMNYTAIGDAVNLASRLEGLNKYYNTSIIVSETIVMETNGDFEYRLLDQVAVKGKQRAIKIYELLGEKGKLSVSRTVVETYEAGFAAYSAREFSRAIELLGTQPDDEPSMVLSERCRALLEDPPPEDWDGIHVATMK